MNKYYFTFGSNPQFPFKQDEYVVVYAETMQDAVALYREKHPDVNEGIINCAFYYNQQQWDKINERYNHEPVEVINRPSSKDVLQQLADYLISRCKEFELDNISLQVKQNGQVLAVTEYKDIDGKQTFVRISRRDASKPYEVI